MAAAKHGTGARKSHATHQTRARKRRARGQASQRAQQHDRAYAEEEFENFARSAERATRSVQKDYAEPIGEGLQQIMRSWMGFFQRSAVTQQRLLQDMLELGSGRRVFEAQRSFVDDSLRNIAESTQEVLRASGRIAEPAVRTAERAAGLAQAYGDHAQAQRRSSGNGSRAFGERRTHEEARR